MTVSVEASAVQAIRWQDEALWLLDQRLLPQTEAGTVCSDARQVADAIASMVVRGAPAIGIAAAYGVAMAARDAWAAAGEDWREAIRPALETLRAARPTAVNLAWAVARMERAFGAIAGDPFLPLVAEADRILAEDLAVNQAMGAIGAAYLAPASRVMTHCNAGALATAGYGTALGVIRSAHGRGLVDQVFATETRPWLQGARLTAWELLRDDIPVTLIADHVAPHLMRTRGLDWVITGADRVAANGDVANKIGTYALAVAARAHGVKFMVVAPISTVDPDTPTGAEIPIEERPGEELTAFGGSAHAAAGVGVYNPVFDVTPADLIDVLVTEKGVAEPPSRETIAALLSN